MSILCLCSLLMNNIYLEQKHVAKFLLEEGSRNRFDMLVDDSLEYRSAQRKDNESLLSAFREGFEREI